MIRSTARQYATAVVDLADRHTPAELASGLRELLHRQGWSSRLPLIQAILKYELPGQAIILEVARSLTADETTTMTKSIEGRWPGRGVRITINPALRQGLRLRIDQRTYDYSLTQTLRQLQQALTEV